MIATCRGCAARRKMLADLRRARDLATARRIARQFARSVKADLARAMQRTQPPPSQ